MTTLSFVVYFLKTKDEVFENLKYLNLKLKSTRIKIKILRSNKGEQHTSNDMTQCCQYHSIIHEVTTPYSF